MNQHERDRIIEVLHEKGVRLPCPRCGTTDFQLADGYFNQPVQTDVSSMQLGGPSIPSVVVVCRNCGYISQHALGALGMLPAMRDTPATEGQKNEPRADKTTE